MSGDAKEEAQGEQLEDLDALEDKVAEAAEAAATAAAHAVAAAKAAEEISKAREEADARTARARDIATIATSEVGASSEATVPNAETPEEQAARVGNGNQMTKPDPVPLASDVETEPGVPTDESPASADEEFGDLLNLDAPHVAMPRVLTRLALIALGTAAVIFVVSLLLVATVPKGTVFDVIVLVAWLGIGGLSVGGFVLLASAGIAKIIRSSGDRS
jgi:hypothetical protein